MKQMDKHPTQPLLQLIYVFSQMNAILYTINDYSSVAWPLLNRMRNI